MPFYRKIPVTIEARHVPVLAEYEAQRLGIVKYVDDCIILADWCGGISQMMLEDDSECHILIPTLEGKMKASPGDYIIKGVNGEFYPCKPDIFAKTYEEEVTNENSEVHT